MKEEKSYGIVEDILLVIILMILFISFIIIVTDGFAYTHIRAEDAKQQCQEQGYDTYTNYKGILREKAYGVKCANYAQPNDPS